MEIITCDSAGMPNPVPFALQHNSLKSVFVVAISEQTLRAKLDETELETVSGYPGARLLDG